MAKKNPQEPETIGDRVKRAREALKMGTPTLAKRVGVTSQTLQDLESGRSKRTSHILALARELGQDPDWLESGKGRMRLPKMATDKPYQMYDIAQSSSVRRLPSLVNVTVIGAVQAGVWGQAFEWSEDDRYEQPVRLNPRYKGLQAIGLEVVGPSMNKVYPHGTVVVCVSFIDLGLQPGHGDHVIVQHLKEDLVEASVKEYRIDPDGVARLWPLSDHPDHQAPLKLTRPPKGEEIRVTHKVVQALIDRP